MLYHCCIFFVLWWLITAHYYTLFFALIYFFYEIRSQPHKITVLLQSQNMWLLLYYKHIVCGLFFQRIMKFLSENNRTNINDKSKIVVWTTKLAVLIQFLLKRIKKHTLFVAFQNWHNLVTKQINKNVCFIPYAISQKPKI